MEPQDYGEWTLVYHVTFPYWPIRPMIRYTEWKPGHSIPKKHTDPFGQGEYQHLYSNGKYMGIKK